MSEREEVLLEPAFVLHKRAFRNTSQIVECLTPRHGRIGVVARGVRSSRGRNRTLLQPFAPLRLSWVRRGELGRLTASESEGHWPALEGEALLAGFYVNELVLRLVARGDPNDDVFSCYSECIEALMRDARVARTLRLFELRMLGALGYGLALDSEAGTGAPLAPDVLYEFEAEVGPRRVAATTPDTGLYRGSELISLREHELEDGGSLRAARRLLGTVLAQHLGERPLNSRAVLRDIVGKGIGR